MPAIWEPFLSEQDKQWLGASGRAKTEPFGFGSKPAVLVIDDYYSVLGLERLPILESVKRWPMSCGLSGWEAIDRTVELLGTARANEIPIVFVKGLPGFPSPWGRRGDRTERFSHLTEEEQAKAGEIVDELDPQPGELIIEKAAASAFRGTPLTYHLNYLGIDTILACGETTSGCVRASVVDGATERYRMGVVEECCFDRTEASHAMNLFDMDQKYADVIDLASAQKYLEQVASDRALAAD